MEYSVFAKSVVGYKNIIKNKGSQDYIYYKDLEDGVITAISDGHGVSRCMCSHRGSEFASKACIEVLNNVYNEVKACDIKDIETKLTKMINEETIQKSIQNNWREKVCNHYKSRFPNVYKVDYIAYGTTLIAAMITEKFNVYVQLGDGNIAQYINNEINILKYNKYNKVKGVVNSMYLYDAYKYIDIQIKINNKNEKINTVLFSDGYTNSFNNYKQLGESIIKTIKSYKQNVFTQYRLKNGYEEYLKYLTINKSKDDISIIFIV